MSPTFICYPNPKGSNALFWPLRAQHAHGAMPPMQVKPPCIQNKRTKRKIKQFKIICQLLLAVFLFLRLGACGSFPLSLLEVVCCANSHVVGSFFLSCLKNAPSQQCSWPLDICSLYVSSSTVFSEAQSLSIMLEMSHLGLGSSSHLISTF